MKSLEVNWEPKYKFGYNQIFNHGFQFALLDENNQVVHTPFMCKDYLHEIFWSETTKKPVAIYGIHWDAGMFNIDQKYFKLAIIGGKENMEARARSLVSFIHKFEKALGIPPTKVYKTDKPESIVLEFHKDWTVGGPMLSSYTTLIRISGRYKIGENPLEYLKSILAYEKSNPYFSQSKDNPFPKYMIVEVQRLKGFLTKLAALLDGQKPDFPWKGFMNADTVHNTGILEYKNYPTKEV